MKPYIIEIYVENAPRPTVDQITDLIIDDVLMGYPWDTLGIKFGLLYGPADSMRDEAAILD